MGAALPIGDPVPVGGTLPDDLVIAPD
ncbi:MAG: hypothetical protein K0S49_1016, partial [Microbacterium sp.]|nr:hypothetical protein [Microbacterium sp.]